jgi:hypothetical protein
MHSHEVGEFGMAVHVTWSNLEVQMSVSIFSKSLNPRKNLGLVWEVIQSSHQDQVHVYVHGSLASGYHQRERRNLSC